MTPRRYHRRMRRRESGFGYQVDGMLVVASTGILCALLLPSAMRSEEKSAVVGTVLLFVLSGLVGTILALARGWHGLGFVLALGQWAGAGIGLAVAFAASLPEPSWYWAIAGASAAGTVVSCVAAEAFNR